MQVVGLDDMGPGFLKESHHLIRQFLVDEGKVLADLRYVRCYSALQPGHTARVPPGVADEVPLLRKPARKAEGREHLA